MPTVDVFNSDPFKMSSMTDSMNKLPYKPGLLGSMGLFKESGIRTTSIIVEEHRGKLALIPTAARGARTNMHQSQKRTARSFLVPHVPLDDAIDADDVTDIRTFGSETELETIADTVNEKLQEMRDSHEVTHEHMRVGAIQGSVKDADGSTVLFNWFTEFGVTETVIDMNLVVSTEKVRLKCLEVQRKMLEACGSIPFTGIAGFCGKTFFTELIDHDDVRTAYERQNNGERFRDDPRGMFEFAGIKFVEYPGKMGSVDFIPTGTCRFVPLGTNLFKGYFAPANFNETVGTKGKAIYAKQAPKKFDMGFDLHTQSNPIFVPLLLDACISGTNT